MGSHLENSSIVDGINSIFLPSRLYATQIFNLSNPVKTSSSVTAKFVIPETLFPCFKITVSSHPILLSRPVVVPYSFPILRIFFEVSQNISVGNAPSPTRVEYAFVIPKTF